MLGFLYTDTITVKLAGATDDYGQPTFTDSTIQGCLQPSTKRTVDNNGNIITSNAVINTMTDLAMNTRFVYNGKEFEIQRKDKVTNHLTGVFSHYSYVF